MNIQAPTMQLFYSKDFHEAACQTGFGIEEEGLLYEVIPSGVPCKDALEKLGKSVMGVSVSVTDGGIDIYYKKLRKEDAFMHYDLDAARLAGHNAARIIKKRPFILEDKNE